MTAVAPTVAQRVDAIRSGMRVLIARMPAGWQGWESGRLAAFKDCLLVLAKAETLPKVTEAAERVCAWYCTTLEAVLRAGEGE